MVSTLLDSPEVRQRTRPITVAQYHVLAEKGVISENTELLEGLLVEKMPKSPLHSSVLQRMLRRLQAIRGEEYEVRSEQPITCQDSEPEPDLALVPISSDDYASGHPTSAEIVVEIAVSSVEIDRRKIAIYAAAGVREYWIVLPDSRQIEVYARLHGSRYSVSRFYSEGETALSVIMPEFQVDLAGLFPG